MPKLKPIRLNIKVSKNLGWIEKYLKKAKKKMPSLILPRQIRSYRPVLTKKHLTLGSCYFTTKVITLATHQIITVKIKKRKRKKHVAMSRKEILMTLAHETAHFRHDLHGYEQESYAEIIFRAFGMQMKCPTCKGKGKIPMPYVNE